MNERQRRAMCTSKIRYRKKCDAIAGVNRTKKIWGRELRVYKCPCCAGWHLTSLNTTKEQR